MSDNNTEILSKNEEKSTQEESSTLKSSSSDSSSTPVRLFGQFKQNGSGFSSFGQFSSTESNSAPSYFTSSIARFSSNSSGAGSGGGFSSSSSTTLAASLAPLSANKEVFGKSNEPKNETEQVEDDEEDDTNEKDENNVENDEDDEQNQSNASLLEKAAEYEAKRASTHPVATIQGDTSTGEEHEVTKYQVTGKLYVYSPDQQQFVERGYGILKINESHDPDHSDRLQARLIMRLDKAFRVILNSPIFPKMTVERATDRSVRFGAQDENHLRVFIIKASPNDCTNLFKELQSRIQIVERQQAVASNKESPTPSTRILKRSHSKSDSESPEKSNDLTKKSKVLEGYRDGEKSSSDQGDEDSVESIKTGEQESSTT